MNAQRLSGDGGVSQSATEFRKTASGGTAAGTPPTQATVEFYANAARSAGLRFTLLADRGNAGNDQPDRRRGIDFTHSSGGATVIVAIPTGAYSDLPRINVGVSDTFQDIVDAWEASTISSTFASVEIFAADAAGVTATESAIAGRGGSLSLSLIHI